MVVAVGENSRGDVDRVSENAAGGVSAAIHLGLDLFDDDAFTAFGRFHWIQFTGNVCVWVHLLGASKEW